jgi:hypothetical protein
MEVAPAWIMTLSYELEVRTKVYDLVVSDGSARADLKTCHDQNLVTIHLVTPITLATTTEPTQPAFRLARIKKKPMPTRKKIPYSAKRRLFRCCGTLQSEPLPGQRCGKIVDEHDAIIGNNCPHRMCAEHTHDTAGPDGILCDHCVAAVGNLLVRRTFQGSRYLLVHPEDLGATKQRNMPGSFLQWEESQNLSAETGAVQGALHQCPFPGARSWKPTRLADIFKKLNKMLHIRMPTFYKLNEDNGPLP